MKNRRNIIESELPPQNPLDIWMKDGKFYRSTKKGWTLIEDQMEFTDSKLMYKSTATSGTIGVNKETGKASIYNDVTKEWSPLGGGLTETTWQELKNKRNAGKLTPGALYRITDYNCTTTQANTRSAGHQFDIVLLALSENKLAEEGWAMEHPTDVYDVTFSDGVIKMCYIYYCSDDSYNIVAVDSKLGMEGIDPAQIVFDENNKTAIVTVSSTMLDKESLQYSYFQNSNLSAWKVWYCLDNDTARFAWAQEAKNEITGIKIGINPSLFKRDNSVDTVVSGTTYYGWKQDGSSYWTYTTTETPKVGDSTWAKSGPPGQFIPMQNPDVSYVDELEQPEGKGVIYRLIDEWNNDVGYDFKNIQHEKNITNGLIDPNYQGINMYIYPFNIWINEKCQDASLVGNTLADDVNTVQGVCNNTILNPPYPGGEEPITLLKVGLNTTCFLSTLEGTEYYGLHNCFVDGDSLECAIENSSFIELIKCNGAAIIDCSALKLITCVLSVHEGQYDGAIYIGDKKVLTEE